jgi:hypothetical protein
LTIDRSTLSASFNENPTRARSKRPSWLGEKNGLTPSSWIFGGVDFRPCATKNAANVRTTRTAKTTFGAVFVTGV